MKKKLFLTSSLMLLSVVLVYSARASEQAKAAKSATTSTPAAGPITLKMLNPTGATEITDLFTSRLADLNGKTVCEVNAGWEGDRTLPLVTDLLKKRFPTVNVIPHTEFPGSRNDADHPRIMELVKKFKCDAMIIGNGG